MIADVDLNFAENATDVTPETLNSELPDSGEMGNLTYDPQSAQIKGTYFSDSRFDFRRNLRFALGKRGGGVQKERVQKEMGRRFAKMHLRLKNYLEAGAAKKAAETWRKYQSRLRNIPIILSAP